MASTFNLSSGCASAAAGTPTPAGGTEGMAQYLASGFLILYDGTQPTNADTALSSNNAYCGNLAYGTITQSTGVLTIPVATGACTRTGTPTFFRAFTSASGAAFDGSVAVSAGTASGSDMNFSSVTGGAFANGGTISISSFTVQIPAH